MISYSKMQSHREAHRLFLMGGPSFAQADMILRSQRLPPQAAVIKDFSQRPGKTEHDGLISQNRRVRAYRYNDVSARRRFFSFLPSGRSFDFREV